MLSSWMVGLALAGPADLGPAELRWANTDRELTEAMRAGGIMLGVGAVLTVPAYVWTGTATNYMQPTQGARAGDVVGPLLWPALVVGPLLSVAGGATLLVYGAKRRKHRRARIEIEHVGFFAVSGRF